MPCEALPNGFNGGWRHYNQASFDGTSTSVDYLSTSLQIDLLALTTVCQ